MLNRLTLLYSKIYYKKENYLKVRTAVFKYINSSIVKVKYIIIIIRSIYSPMRFPYRSIQTVLAITKKILPVPIWRQKPRKYIGKMPCLG